MDENVAKNDLLKELEAVALLADRLDQLSDAVAAQRWNEFSMRVPAEPHRDADLVLASVARFIRTHHAEIAEALKDARRLDFIECECVTVRCEATVDDDVYYEAVDYYMAEPKERVIGIGKTPRDAIDNAMHSSAREDGE